MNFEKVNVNILDQYEKRFQNHESFVLLDSSPMNVSDSEKFRKDLYNMNSRLLVCKNQILKILLKKKGYDEIGNLKGSGTAVVFIEENALKVFRIIKKYETDLQFLTIKSGLFEGTLVDTKSIKKLANIPSRKVLLTKLCLIMKSPIQNFHQVLQSILQNAVGVIRAIKEKKEDNQS